MKLTYVDLSTKLSASSTMEGPPYQSTYNFILKATMANPVNVITHEEPFSLVSKNPCIDILYNWINIPALTLIDEEYRLYSGDKFIDLYPYFSVENSLCGEINISVIID